MALGLGGAAEALLVHDAAALGLDEAAAVSYTHLRAHET